MRARVSILFRFPPLMRIYYNPRLALKIKLSLQFDFYYYMKYLIQAAARLTNHAPPRANAGALVTKKGLVVSPTLIVV